LFYVLTVISLKIPIMRHLDKTGQTFSLCLRKNRGSITVEASMILPIMIMTLVGFIFLFQVLMVQLRLQSAIDKTADQVSTFYHLESVLPDVFSGLTSEDAQSESLSNQIRTYFKFLVYDSITSAYFKDSVFRTLSKSWLDESCIVGGGDGIDFLAQIRYADGAYIVLKTTYSVKIPFLPKEVYKLELCQQTARRMWNGLTRDVEEEPEEESGQHVYVTKYGEVYHLYRDCVTLKRNIKSVALSSVPALRNSEGERYTACSYCIHGSKNALVYVTEDGTKYHNSSTCSALIRYIDEVDISEVGDKGCCSYCSKRLNETEAEE